MLPTGSGGMAPNMKKTTDDQLRVRFRLDFGAACAIGHGKIQLLEGIERTGSLSQAARDMDMSYRRAWLLLDSLNNSFDMPVAGTAAGGKGGGGAVLTEFGKELVAAYRNLEAELTVAARKHLRAVERHVVSIGKPVRGTKSAVVPSMVKPLPPRRRADSRH